jgi:hypothetical protein
VTPAPPDQPAMHHRVGDAREPRAEHERQLPLIDVGVDSAATTRRRRERRYRETGSGTTPSEQWRERMRRENHEHARLDPGALEPCALCGGWCIPDQCPAQRDH